MCDLALGFCFLSEISFLVIETSKITCTIAIETFKQISDGRKNWKEKMKAIKDRIFEKPNLYAYSFLSQPLLTGQCSYKDNTYFLKLQTVY
jgi:hypothetical protein